MDVRTICLGILTRGEATGYEIKKLFDEDGYQHFVEASFGSIYPALTSSPKTASSRCAAKPRKSGPTGRSIRSRRPAAPVPRIPDEAPARGPAPFAPFLFAMLFSHILPTERVRPTARHLSQQSRRKLAQLEKVCAETAGERFAVGLGRAVSSGHDRFLRGHRGELETAARTAAE